MRWISSEESAQNAEPSVLAIVETIIAMAISLWIAMYFDTVTHIIIGACLAPFLLLRTDASDRLGMRFWLKVWGYSILLIGQGLNRTRVYKTIFIVAILGFVFVPVRILAILATVIQNLVSCIRAIPRNWQQIIIATDFFISPKILHEPNDTVSFNYSQVGIDKNRFSTYHIVLKLKLMRSGSTWLESLTSSFALLLFLLSSGIPALLYRWSLKSTAIIWFPLLWALNAGGNKPLDARLKLCLRSDLFRWLKLPISVTAIGLFIMKLCYWNQLSNIAIQWNESLFGRIVTIYAGPDIIEWWQFATVLNSLIAIGLWLYIRSCLRHIEENAPRPEANVKRILTVTHFVACILSTYSIVCVAYMYCIEMGKWNLPPLGGKLFPW